MKFGVVQANNLAGIENVGHNREVNGQMVKDLFQNGAKIVILPECSNHQYLMESSEEVRSFSEDLDGPSIAQWIELAATYNGYIVGGIIEQNGGKLYNTAVLVGPKGYIGHYRKVHLFNWEMDYLSPGDLGFPTLAIPEFDIKVGILICYDLRFPEAVRSLALAGCDVLLVPTTWTSIGKTNYWDELGYCRANYLAIAHSHTNRLPIVCADRVGLEGNVQYLGASMILDSHSNVVAGPASKMEADLLIGEMDILSARNKSIGDKNDLLKDRRPQLYFND